MALRPSTSSTPHGPTSDFRQKYYRPEVHSLLTLLLVKCVINRHSRGKTLNSCVIFCKEAFAITESLPSILFIDSLKLILATFIAIAMLTDNRRAEDIQRAQHNTELILL